MAWVVVGALINHVLESRLMNFSACLRLAKFFDFVASSFRICTPIKRVVIECEAGAIRVQLSYKNVELLELLVVFWNESRY